MRRSRGFSLLEVMVAVAILGLTLTVILSAQGGLAASNKSANNVGTAIDLGRCKMTELEEKLLKLGYPEVDDIQTGVNCCNDEEVVGVKCDTRAEKILLPNPPSTNLGADGGGLALSSLDAGGGGLPGALGAVVQGFGGNAEAGTASLDFDGGLSNLGSSLTSQLGPMTGGAGTAGLLTMVMSFVYPTLKPMMEMSIRRLTVTVRWKEGPNAKEFALVQYVTNPTNGGFVAGAPVASASSGTTTGAPPPTTGVAATAAAAAAGGPMPGAAPGTPTRAFSGGQF